jgi:hypothetical protein
MSALNTKMGDLTTLAAKLQQQAAAGKLPASEAVDQVLTAFLNLLGLLRGSLSASGGSASSNKALAALDRCQEQANAGARMVREAASKQGGVSADAAVQHLSTLLTQLAADLSRELISLGPADAARSIKFELPGGFGGSSAGGSGGNWRATPSQGSAQLVDVLQGVLAGGMEQGLTAAGGAVKEVGHEYVFALVAVQLQRPYLICRSDTGSSCFGMAAAVSAWLLPCVRSVSSQPGPNMPTFALLPVLLRSPCRLSRQWQTS